MRTLGWSGCSVRDCYVRGRGELVVPTPASGQALTHILSFIALSGSLHTGPVQDRKQSRLYCRRGTPSPRLCLTLASSYALPSLPRYYATPVPTSAQTASPQAARGPRRTRHSVHLGLNDLEELQAALREAAQAAENVRSTTRQLSRSLSADLRHARSLRGSCLF